MPSIQAVILAGGGSVRMRPLSRDTQKGLLPVANKPLVCSQLELLEKAGLKDVIIVTTESSANDMRAAVGGPSSMDHIFHMHTNSMQLQEVPPYARQIADPNYFLKGF